MNSKYLSIIATLAILLIVGVGVEKVHQGSFVASNPVATYGAVDESSSATSIQHKIQNVIKLAESVLSILNSVTERLETHIGHLEKGGYQLGEARGLLREARIHTAEFEVAINELGSILKDSTSVDVIHDVNTEKLKAAVKTAREEFHSARNLMLETIEAIRFVTREGKDEIIFKSGFESGVSVIGPTEDPSRFLVHAFTGTDSETGYTWPADLPGGLNEQWNHFAYWVLTGKNLENFVETRIENVIGPDGNTTRALYQEVKADDPDDESRTTRNAYTIRAFEDPSELDELYVRYWLKLQPDLEQNWRRGTWRIFMELWEQKNNSRITFSVDLDNSPTGKLFWRVTSESKQCPSCSWELNWGEVSPEEVPLGEWFLLESYWKHTTDQDGIVWVKVNGKKILEHKGPNQERAPIDRYNLFKVYTSEGFLNNGPAYQWVDDVVICRDPSCVEQS